MPVRVGLGGVVVVGDGVGSLVVRGRRVFLVDFGLSVVLLSDEPEVRLGCGRGSLSSDPAAFLERQGCVGDILGRTTDIRPSCCEIVDRLRIVVLVFPAVGRRPTGDRERIVSLAFRSSR